MWEYITLLSSIILLLVVLYGLYKNRDEIYYSWIISSLAFLMLGVALVVMGLDALGLPITPYIGSLYPSFLALGILLINYRKTGYYYLTFIIIMIIFMFIGSGVNPLYKTISQIILHSISGLTIVFIPVYYVAKRLCNKLFIVMSLGGITIGIGGLALATIIAGKPILPLDLVIQLLHPILALSAILISIGIYSIKDMLA